MGFHVLGLTGGIGSGKSTVAERLRARGVPVISADELARAATEPGAPALGEIVAAFGRGVLTERGTLDRARLAEIVFSDAPALERLNAIVHPRVQEMKNTKLEELEQQGHEIVVYDVPLLFEAGLADTLRPVVVVHAEPAQQLERVKRRDGHTEEQIAARIAAQWPLARKVALADYVIDNSGSRAETEAQTDKLLQTLKARWGLLTAPPE